MAKKDNKPTESASNKKLTAVDFTNSYNSDVENFNVELSLQVSTVGNSQEVVAGISIDMGDGGMPAFIPADILRLLADEAEASAHEMIARANRNRG